MIRNIIAALIVMTLILSSHSYALDLKEAIFAASIAYQRDPALSATQKEALANARNACAAVSDAKDCGDFTSAPCLWTSESCHLDEERFALALKIDNVVNLGKGALLLGFASIVASAMCGVAGIGLGIVCLGVGHYLASDAPLMKAHFDASLQSKRRKVSRPS